MSVTGIGDRCTVPVRRAGQRSRRTGAGRVEGQDRLVLGLVKWGSLIAVLGLLLASGMIALGRRPWLRRRHVPGAEVVGDEGRVALVIVASAAQIVNFVS